MQIGIAGQITQAPNCKGNVMFTSEDIKVMRELAREMYVSHEITADAYASAVEDIRLAEQRAGLVSHG